MGMDPKALERLHNSEDFLAFLEEVMSQREGWISNLHDRSTFSIQQISGRICALDDVLNAAQYKTLRAKWASLKQ
jgi:hypothetical protein